MNVLESSLSEAVKTISERNVPVLAIDTCALLDIIRIPVRNPNSKIAKDTLESVLAILSMLEETPPRVAIVVNKLIMEEWIQHREAVCTEVITYLDRLDEQNSTIVTLAGALGKDLKVETFGKLKIEKELLRLSEAFLLPSVSLTEDSTIMSAATSRAVGYTPPARKGAIKDCIIYEHNLELFRLLRNSSFSKKLVFLTSNVNDYFDQKASSLPVEPIDGELKAVSADMVSNWQWACHLLSG